MTRGQRESEERIKEPVELTAARQTALDRARDDLAHELLQFTAEQVRPPQVSAIVTVADAICKGMSNWPKVYKPAVLAVKKLDK